MGWGVGACYTMSVIIGEIFQAVRAGLVLATLKDKSSPLRWDRRSMSDGSCRAP